MKKKSTIIKELKVELHDAQMHVRLRVKSYERAVTRAKAIAELMRKVQAGKQVDDVGA